jgi:hypothetical protein
MASTVQVVRDRVIENLQDFDRSKPAFSIPQYDIAIKGAYQIVAARMPWPHVHTASGLTLTAGVDTFTLSTNLGGDLRLRRRSDGFFLEKVTVEQLDAYRTGVTATNLANVASTPWCFAVWLQPGTAGTDLSGRVFPPPNAANVSLDTYFSQIPTALSSTALDSDNVLFDVTTVEALILKVSVTQLAKLPKSEMDRLMIDPSIGKEWKEDYERTVYRATGNRFDQDSNNATYQRWVP